MKITSKKVKVLRYEVIEDDGGGLSLYVWRGKKLTYIHSGYEYCPGQLTGDIKSLRQGADPAADWEGNEIGVCEYPTEGWDFSLEVIADNAGFYPGRMNGAGQTEFRKILLMNGKKNATPEINMYEAFTPEEIGVIETYLLLCNTNARVDYLIPNEMEAELGI